MQNRRNARATLVAALTALLVLAGCKSPVAVEHTVSSGNHTVSSGNLQQQ